MFCNHYVLQYSTVGQNGNNNFVIFHSVLKDTIIVYCNIPHWATEFNPFMLQNPKDAIIIQGGQKKVYDMILRKSV